MEYNEASGKFLKKILIGPPRKLKDQNEMHSKFKFNNFITITIYYFIFYKKKESKSQ